MADQKPVDKTVESINAAVGKRVAVRLGDNAPSSEVVEVLPSPLLVVDKYVLGAGGLPVGRLIEVYSEEGVGKTAFGLGCIAAVQQAGGRGVLVETENRLMRERLVTFGVDTDSLVLAEPNSAEEMLRCVEGVLDSAGDVPTIAVVDSIAAAPSQKELDEGLVGKSAHMARAQILTRAIRVMAKKVVQRRVLIIAINHQKTKPGVMFGDKIITPGGDALKYYASARLWFTGGSAVKRNDLHVGKDITVLASKNLFAPPWRKAKIRLMYDTGWDEQWSTIDHAKTKGWIKKEARTTQSNYDNVLSQLEEHGWSTTKPKEKERKSKAK